MYCIIRFNWDITKFALTNKKVVGYFDTPKAAYATVVNTLPFDEARNSVAIVRMTEGIDQYSHPMFIFEWCEQYGFYAQVCSCDVRYDYTFPFTSGN